MTDDDLRRNDPGTRPAPDRARVVLHAPTPADLGDSRTAGRHPERVHTAGAGPDGPPFRTEDLELMVGYAFGTLGLHRLSMQEMEYNEEALETARTCGFVVEGRERESAQVDGTWYDLVLLGLLADEWEAREAA